VENAEWLTMVTLNNASDYQANELMDY